MGESRSAGNNGNRGDSHNNSYDVRGGQSGDARTYRWAGIMLRLGMYTSLAVMGIGLVWWLLVGAPGGQASASRAMPPDRIPTELVMLNPAAMLNLGVLLLLVTPGVALLVEMVTFAMDGNWRYAGIAALVAAILTLSVAISMQWLPWPAR
jgi:uncharacterized membrane protein